MINIFEAHAEAHVLEVLDVAETVLTRTKAVTRRPVRFWTGCRSRGEAAQAHGPERSDRRRKGSNIRQMMTNNHSDVDINDEKL
jgi:hypothetical protein